MTMLDSVLREKHLRRMHRLQDLATIRLRCDASAQALAAARRRYEEARTTLWQAMTAEELCIQTWLLARGQEDALRRGVEEALAEHARDVDEREGVQRALARIEKDIEKLEERVRQRREEASLMQCRREWNELDDWVLGRDGATK